MTKRGFAGPDADPVDSEASSITIPEPTVAPAKPKKRGPAKIGSRKTPVAKSVSRTKKPSKPAAATSAAAPARTRKPRSPDPSQPNGALLIERVTQAIERELTQIETIVGGSRVSASRRTEAERRARTLASLARTLAEVTRLRAAQPEPRPADDDDAVPRDLDEFRETLERRLAQMVASAEDKAAGGDD